MKLLAAKEEQFLTDAKGKRTGAVRDLQTYEHLRAAELELTGVGIRGAACARLGGGTFATGFRHRAALDDITTPADSLSRGVLH
jgi:hypothetical protein